MSDPQQKKNPKGWGLPTFKFTYVLIVRTLTGVIEVMSRSSKNCRPLIHIYGRLHLTLHDAEDAAKVALIDSETSNFLVIPKLSNDKKLDEAGEQGFDPSSLSEIFRFDQMICQIELKYPSQKLVLCAGRSMLLQARAAFLVGCHLIISRGNELEETYMALERLHGVFEKVSWNVGVSVRSCLSSIHTAKKRDWIDFRERFDTLPTKSRSIPIQEYMHYARCSANMLAIPV
jgi:hypothetical protein